MLLGERERVQKKTFTKWVNSHLIRVESRVNELYQDLKDGRKLITLLEILSGEKIVSRSWYLLFHSFCVLIKLFSLLFLKGKPAKGRMRIHMMENVEKALQFLKVQKVPRLSSHRQKQFNSLDITFCWWVKFSWEHCRHIWTERKCVLQVHLENIGAQDIVDGNPRLTLGLIWTIILRFQVTYMDKEITLERKQCFINNKWYNSVNVTMYFTSRFKTFLLKVTAKRNDQLKMPCYCGVSQKPQGMICISYFQLSTAACILT